jgi:hypothetical protein
MTPKKQLAPRRRSLFVPPDDVGALEEEKQVELPSSQNDNQRVPSVDADSLAVAELPVPIVTFPTQEGKEEEEKNLQEMEEGEEEKQEEGNVTDSVMEELVGGVVGQVLQELAVKKQLRNRKIYDYEKPWFDDSSGRSVFLTEEQLELALLNLAAKEFQGNKVNGVLWQRKQKLFRKKEKDFRTVMRCPWHWQSGCPFQICVLTDEASGCSRIFISIYKHEHGKNILKRGLALEVKTGVVTSPKALRTGSVTFVREQIQKKSLFMQQKEQTQTVNFIQERKKKFKKEMLGGADPNTYEGLKVACQCYIRSVMEECNNSDFTENTMYVAGGEFIIDAVKQRVCVLFSTENLLLNIYRQQCTGQDLTFAVDASYRYMYEGYALVPIMCVNFSQSGKVVAYALTSHEDTEALTFIFSMLKKEVEKIVRNRIKKNVLI